MEILNFMCWKLIGTAANLEYLLLCNKEASAWDIHSKMMGTLVLYTSLWMGHWKELKSWCILVETWIAVTVHFDWMQRCIVFTLHPHLINDIKIIPGPTFALDPEWHVYETLHQNNIPSLLHLTFIAASSVVSLWSSNLEARHIKDQIEKKQEKTFEFFKTNQINLRKESS